MRNNVEINDALLSRAMIVAGLSTKRATGEESLRLLVQVREQAQALKKMSRLGWEGDLAAMREGRPPHAP